MGDYYGTPAWNYVFWLFIAALLTFAISPNRVPGGPLLLMYTLSWLVTFIVVLLFNGLLVPGLVGFFVMGLVLVMAAINSGR